MDAVNCTAVQMLYHRRAILNRGAAATRLLGWRRNVGAIGFSPNRCREVVRRQPKSRAALVSQHSGSSVGSNQQRTDSRQPFRFHDPWAGWVPRGKCDSQTSEAYYKADSALPLAQSSGGEEIPQMFSGLSSLIPQCRGWSGSTYTTSAAARLSVT